MYRQSFRQAVLIIEEFSVIGIRPLQMNRGPCRRSPQALQLKPYLSVFNVRISLTQSIYHEPLDLLATMTVHFF